MLTDQQKSVLMSLLNDGASAATASPSHETNDIQSYGIEELANAVKALSEAVNHLNAKLEETCKKVDAIESTSGAFIGNWERLAKEKSRADGIGALKSKYGEGDYAETARVFQESEGEDIYGVIYDLVEEARESASNAESGAEQAEFDEDGFVKNVFDGVGGKIKKLAELSKPKVEAVEVEIEKKPEAEPVAEVKTEKVEMPEPPSVAEQIRKSKKKQA